MADELRKGDRVAWNTSQGRTTGTVEKKLTRPTKIRRHKVEASPETRSTWSRASAPARRRRTGPRRSRSWRSARSERRRHWTAWRHSLIDWGHAPKKS